MTAMAGTVGRGRWPGWGRVIVLALIGLLLIAVVTPLVWAVLVSVTSEAEYLAIPIQVLPSAISLEAYQAVLSDGDLLRGFVNSLIVSGLEVAGVLLTSSLAGYVFARKQFLGAR